MINTMCPNTLFPYARQLISSLVGEGGFPPLVLQPVNFEQMYAQRMQQMMEEQNKDADPKVMEKRCHSRYFQPNE